MVQQRFTSTLVLCYLLLLLIVMLGICSWIAESTTKESTDSKPPPSLLSLISLLSATKSPAETQELRRAVAFSVLAGAAGSCGLVFEKVRRRRRSEIHFSNAPMGYLLMQFHVPIVRSRACAFKRRTWRRTSASIQDGVVDWTHAPRVGVDGGIPHVLAKTGAFRGSKRSRCIRRRHLDAGKEEKRQQSKRILALCARSRETDSLPFGQSGVLHGAIVFQEFSAATSVHVLLIGIGLAGTE